jgi:hypothetical protein
VKLAVTVGTHHLALLDLRKDSFFAIPLDGGIAQIELFLLIHVV